MSDVVQIVKQELQNALDIKDVQGDIKVVNKELQGLREQHREHSMKMEDGFEAVTTEIKNISAQINTWKGSVGILIMAAGFVGYALPALIKSIFSVKVGQP